MNARLPSLPKPSALLRSGITKPGFPRRRICLTLSCLALVALILACCGPAGHGCQPTALTPPSCGGSAIRGCTVVTVSSGDRVFFGGNDDYHNRDSTYWVDAGLGDHYGAIYFGKKDNVQQGLNEMGLAYDANGLPRKDVESHPGTKPVYDSYGGYIIRILRECATVEEVIAWVREHRWHEYMHDQMHFADAGGDAVIISVGPDGKVAYTRKPPGDSFLVSTNFNVADPSNGAYPCWRYDRAEEMLGRMDDGALTVDAVASVMDAVHVENPQGWTLYSLVADLQQRLVYIYFWFQYDAPIVLSIDEEIARAPDTVALSSLFPPETLASARAAEDRLMDRPARCDAAGLVWIALVAASVLILLLLVRPGRRGLVLWLSVVLVLGPFGLLACLLARRGWRTDPASGDAEVEPAAQKRFWPRALAEAACDLPPYVVGVMTCLLLSVAGQLVGQLTIVQFLPILLYAIPLVLGLVFYQGPLLARATRSRYLRTMWRRLPAVLISTNLAVAGMVAASLPLLKWQTNYCPFSGPMLLAWWAIIAIGASLGGLLLYAYHAWAVGQGFVAWSALLWHPGERSGDSSGVNYPSWRRLWLWLVLSTIALLAGMALGVSAL